MACSGSRDCGRVLGHGLGNQRRARRECHRERRARRVRRLGVAGAAGAAAAAAARVVNGGLRGLAKSARLTAASRMSSVTAPMTSATMSVSSARGEPNGGGSANAALIADANAAVACAPASSPART